MFLQYLGKGRPKSAAVARINVGLLTEHFVWMDNNEISWIPTKEHDSDFRKIRNCSFSYPYDPIRKWHKSNRRIDCCCPLEAPPVEYSLRSLWGLRKLRWQCRLQTRHRHYRNSHAIIKSRKNYLSMLLRSANCSFANNFFYLCRALKQFILKMECKYQILNSNLQISKRWPNVKQPPPVT